MATNFVIPSLFTAINGFSGPVNAMAASMNGLTTSVARAQLQFGNMFPYFDKTVNKALDFTKTAAAAAGTFALFGLATKGIIDYQKNLTKFRIIVDDISDVDFKRFEKAISSVASETRSSMSDVASAFESIAALNPDLAKTAESISDVTKATILLSRAGSIDLKDSAASLATIMNQYNLTAADAMRTANAIAAAQGIGASSIKQTAESFKNFGSVALAANISLERSLAAIQVLGKFGLYEEEAGTKLRGVVLELQQAGLGYSTGKFDLVEALSTAKTRYNALGSSIAKDAYAIKIFGQEGIVAGQTLLKNIPLLQEYEQKVTGTQEAQKQAAIATHTLAFAFGSVASKFQNFFIESSFGSFAMTTLTDAVLLFGDSLSIILPVVISIITPLLAYKGALIVASAATRLLTFWTNALKLAQGFLAVVTGTLNGQLLANAAAAKGAAAAYWAMSNPVVLATSAIVGLLFYVSQAEYDLGRMQKVVKNVNGEFVEVVKPINAATIALEKFNKAKNLLTEIENFRVAANFERNQGNYWQQFLAEHSMNKRINELNDLTEKYNLRNVVFDSVASNRYVDSLNNEIKSFQDNSKPLDEVVNNYSKTETLQKQQLEITINDHTNGRVSVDSTGSLIPIISKTR